MENPFEITADRIHAACRTLQDTIEPGYCDFVFADPELPIDAEFDLIECFARYASIPPDAWATVRAMMDRKLAYSLWSFAFRMCILAVRSKDSRCLIAAAVAICIGEDHLDYRDRIIYLGIINDAAERIGTNVGDMFPHVPDHVNPDRANVLQPHDSMMHKGIREGKQFIYVEYP